MQSPVITGVNFPDFDPWHSTNFDDEDLVSAAEACISSDGIFVDEVQNEDDKFVSLISFSIVIQFSFVPSF